MENETLLPEKENTPISDKTPTSNESTPLFRNRIELEALRESVAQIRSEVAKLVVGQHQNIDLMIAAILAGGHILLEGVPGVAKTLTAKVISKVMDIDFSRIQFTPDLMPSDVIGTNIFNPKTTDFEFRKGPIFSNVVLIDEINRAPAKTQSALFEVMEERQITISNYSFKMDAPFMIIATQNPIEQEGTYRLPEAQLDRFIFKLEVSYPSLSEEINIIAGFHERLDANQLELIDALISKAQLLEYRNLVHHVKVDVSLIEYIAKIIDSTRKNNALYLGASPRASIAILVASKAFAAMNGRDFVTPDDIKTMVYPVLNHRLILTPEKEMEGVSVKSVIKQIVESVEVPR
jgi:MoxR-like ATPase